MASPRMHPRRSPNSPLSSRSLISSTVLDIATLKKGATFHSPTSPSGEDDPKLNIPSLPLRSSTSLKELDDVVAATPSERIQRIIGAVDRSLSDLNALAAEVEAESAKDDFPVPKFLVGGATKDADVRRSKLELTAANLPASPIRKHHASDSGIGSTVSSEEDKMALSKQGMICPPPPVSHTDSPDQAAEGRVKTGINGVSTMATATQHVLSEYACRQIQKHIIIPIMREQRLKKFHPLVSGLPYRISRKEITCLRDLEKVLLWLAPKYSVSKASFLLFCETTIQCLHTAVDHLNDRDQRRPADRPYTNAYFVDLVEQVRQYAAHLATSNSRMSSDERVELIGGLGRTGHQAELVRTKDGRSISLRTGEEITEEYKQNLKRSSAQIEEDLELERSMARRKKNAPIEKQMQKCSECAKIFKRPCDLTKHEKTHSRPWKCSESSCKYHEYGWPTEKERDRHVNDKHSSAPTLFKCRFHPCPYESKRESNCKQHMEKAHGWTYVKSKSNGKSKRPTGPGMTPPTPMESTPGSNIFSASSPEMFSDGTFGTPISHHRTASIDSSAMNHVSPELTNFASTFGPGNEFTWPDVSNDYTTELLNSLGSTSGGQMWDASAMANPEVAPSAFDNLSAEDISMFGADFDWSNMDQADLTALNVQLATPALSVDQLPAELFGASDVSSFSPTGQGQQMLCSPYSINSSEAMVDEGCVTDYTHEMHGSMKPMGDFSLFDATTVSSLNTSTKDAMFDDLSAFTQYGRGGLSGMDQYMSIDD